MDFSIYNPPIGLYQKQKTVMQILFDTEIISGFKVIVKQREDRIFLTRL